MHHQITNTQGVSYHKSLVQYRYQSNPYHNATHAAAVVYGMYKLMTSGGVAYAIAGEQAPRDLVLLGGILAAAVHDYGHLGVTNDFLVKVPLQKQCWCLCEKAAEPLDAAPQVSNPLALTHNDMSPHENHHVAAAFSLLQDKCFDFTEQLASEVGHYDCILMALLSAFILVICMQERQFLRRTCIAMVLQTDMQQHFATLTRFELRKAVVRDWGKDPTDMSLVLSMAIKVSLLCNLDQH